MRTNQPGTSPSVARTATQAGVAVLRVAGLAKAFGPTRALRSASLELRAGEVHALIGENGSGKSTLVKLLTGVHRPDSGEIELDGAVVGPRRSPRAALDAGIVAVFQEVLTIGPRSMVDNVWLGADGLFRQRVSHLERYRRAGDVLTELLGAEPDLDAPAEELSLSERQACCIARALVRSPRVLILDEATSALDVATRDRLFGIIRRLAAEGTSVVFISHRMDEIEEIGDRITVMRSGETVATVRRGEASAAQLVRLMTGAEHLTGEVAAAAPRRALGKVVLRARGVRLAAAAASIDLEVRAGELIGLAGLEGHGQDAFLHALRGGAVVEGAVLRETESGAVPVRSPFDAAAHGVVYVPRERRAEALFEWLSVRDNFALPTIGRDTTAGIVRTRRSERRLAGYVQRLGVKLNTSRDAITTLSGGNQQKVVMARWLAAEPQILLLNDPTRGVDLGAKRDLYALFYGLAELGVAVVMLSTELEEHVELMDRVLVFREQEVFTVIERAALSRGALVAGFFGQDGSGHA